MTNVVRLPKAIVQSPDGPIFVTEADRVIVHGRKPIDVGTREALQIIIAAARKKIRVDP